MATWKYTEIKINGQPVKAQAPPSFRQVEVQTFRHSMLIGFSIVWRKASQHVPIRSMA